MNKMFNTKYKILNTKNLFVLLLFTAAFLERVVFDLGPNVELVTAAMILSAYYLGSRQSVLLTMAIMILSDLILGNSRIFIFTWTGFLIPALLASSFGNKLFAMHGLPNIKLLTKTISLTFTSLSANIFFYLWTNFGVWLLSNMYTKNISGLLMSYINGIPFLKNQFVSSVVFIPVLFVLTESAIKMKNKYYFQRKLNNNFIFKLI